jgi:hypothetical protein
VPGTCSSVVGQIKGSKIQDKMTLTKSNENETSSCQTLVKTSLEELKYIFYALVGGARYGVKIRLPHAIIMTCLFRKDLSSKQKLQTILHMTMEHSKNLATFAACYKLVLAVLKHVSIRRGKNV